MMIPVFVCGFLCGFLGFAASAVIVLTLAYRAGNKLNRKE